MTREELLRSARNLYENPGTNEALKRVLEETYPELLESEDESIRKSLIEYFESLEREEWFGIEVEKILAYLEKMKRFSNLEPGLFIYNESGILSKPFDEATTNEIPGKDYVPVDWVETLERYGKWKIVKVDEQKPTEWSEKDEKMLGLCVDAASGYYDPNEKQVLKDWLKSLPERFNLQPKEGMRELIDCAEAEGAKDVINNPERYGLQKLAEWSEEDEKIMDEMRETFMNLIGDKPDISPGQKWSAAINFIDKLQSLRPQPHWKPSEEQMKELKIAVDEHFDIDGGPLWDLYNDLKKL